MHGRSSKALGTVETSNHSYQTKAPLNEALGTVETSNDPYQTKGPPLNEAKVITKLRTFADACALPNAKRIMLPGRTGPVNAVEAGGELFIQNDEAEAEAEAIRAPEAESTAAALGSELPCAAASPTVMTPKSYAAVVKASVVTTAPAQPAAVPKFSAAVSMPSSDVKPSAAASQLAEDTTSLKELDDFADAQSTPLPEFVAGIEGDKEGEFYAHSAAFGITSLIPKSFLNQSFEAEEAAKELTIQAAKKIKAEEKAKQVATKSAASKQAKVPNTKQKTHQKPAKDKKNTEQTMASAPAKEDAPAMHCSMSFRAFVLVGITLVTAFYQSTQPSAFTVTKGLTSGAAEVATKTVSSWSNALDKPGLFEINAPNDDQCGLFDVGAPSHDQRGPFDAPNDSQCALK